MADIWLWQRIVTPHMAGLAVALANRGHSVTYVAECIMSEERARQGWRPPILDGVRLCIVPDANSVALAVAQAEKESVHLCQGIRANGMVSVAQQALKRRGLRQWLVMETVEDDGVLGILKRLIYRALFTRWRRHLQGVLACGWSTAGWVIARGMPPEKVFSFAYFLPDVTEPPEATSVAAAPFRFLFVGQFIDRKRLDLLIDVLGRLAADVRADFRLQVVGSGPLEEELRNLARRALGERLEWTGTLPMESVRQAMCSADCLVLPSRHDGWGAVVSEALMSGTPAICSDACGAAGVVAVSGAGGVFPAGKFRALYVLLQAALRGGKITPGRRHQLSTWAVALGATVGAEYLTEIIGYSAGTGSRPGVPWVVAAV